MNFKKTDFKKVLTSLIVLGLIFGPVSPVFSTAIPSDQLWDSGSDWLETSNSSALLSGPTNDWQAFSESSTLISSDNSNVLSGDWYEYDTSNVTNSDNFYSPTGSSGNYVETDNGLGNRQQLDSQSSDQAAQGLEEQQKQDEQECNKQGTGSGASALGQALGPTMESSAGQALEQSAKTAIPQTIKEGTAKIVPEIVKTSLTTQLPTAIQNEFPAVLQDRLVQEATKGTNLSDSTTMNNVVKNELNNFLNQKIPTILNQSISTQLPSQLSDYLNSNLAGNITSLMGDNLSSLLQQNIPTALNNNLTDQIDSSLRYNLASSSVNLKETQILNLDRQILGSIQNQVLSGFSSQMPDLSSTINQQLTSSLAPMISELSSKISGELGQELSSQIANSVSSNLGTAIAGQISSHVMGTLNDAIGNSVTQITGQLGISIDQITSAIANPIDNSINQVMNSVNQSLNQITSSIMTPINQSMNQVLSALDDSIMDITGTFTNALTGTMSELTSALTNPLTDVMNEISGAVIDPVTGALTDLTSNITAPFTESLGKLTSSITDPFTNAIGDLTNTITAPLTDALGGIGDSVFSGAGDLAGSIVGSGSDWSSGAVVTSQQISSTANPATTAATQGTLQSVTGAGAMTNLGLSVIAGAYVPVKEQDGPLLKATKNIDTTTGDIKKLTVEICKHTKSLKRIQQKFEQKEFSDDPTARAEARTKLVDYTQGLKNLFDSGYEVDGSGAKAPVYPTNYKNHLAQQAKEASEVFTETVKNSGNNDATEINQALVKIKQEGAELLKSTISKETRDKMLNDPASMSASEGWEAFLQTSEPNNNTRGSIILALDLQSQSEQLAIGSARDEYLAGNGFLPIRQCVAKTADGLTCKEWQTTTPASVNETMADTMMNLRKDLYLQAKNKDEVADGNEPQVKEVATFQPATSGGGWSGTSGSGSGSGGLNLSSLLNLFQSQSGSGSSGLGNFDQFFSSQLNEQTSDDTTKPTVSIKLTRTGIRSASLKWTATAGASCKAGNDWYTLGTSGETQIVKALGESLSSNSDSLKISIPIPTSNVKLLIRQNAFIYEIGTTVRTSTNGLVKETTFSLANDPSYHPQVADVYTLKVGDQSVSFTNNTDQVATGIAGLKDAVGKLDPSSETGKKFSQIKLAFNSTSGKITASMAVRYKLSCTNSAGTTEAETTN